MKLETLASHFFTTTGITIALLTGFNTKTMDMQLAAAAPKKADYKREADEIAQLLEKSGIPGITAPLTHLKSIFPGKSFLEIHQTLLKSHHIHLEDLTDEDKRALVTWYQKIYVQLSRMKPEEKTEHPLRFYKTRIYAIGLALFTNDKDAAKAWLKSAECYSDEEKELDEFATQKEPSLYRRTHYLAGKHSLTIQQKRGKDAETLTQTLQSHQQAADVLDAQVQRFDAQIKELLKRRNGLAEQKKLNADEQNKVMKALETNGMSITDANTVYSESLKALHQQLLDRTTRIKHLREEEDILRAQTPKDAPTKETKQRSLQQRDEEIAQCIAEQAAIQRDIDLLTGEYSLAKKVLWKLSGTITRYPVEIPTPGKPTEEKKDGQPAEEQEEQEEKK